MRYKTFNNSIYESLNKFSITYFALILISIWAFFEASIWFIIPDFLIIILILVNPKFYKKFFLITFISSVIGITSYYLFVQLKSDLAFELLIKTPFTNSLMIEKITNLYANEGIISILKQAFSGIPSKVWTFAAEKSNLSFFQYIPLVAISRGIRIFVISFIISKTGDKYKYFIKDNFCSIFLIYTIIFFIVLSMIS